MQVRLVPGQFFRLTGIKFDRGSVTQIPPGNGAFRLHSAACHLPTCALTIVTLQTCIRDI